ncbi:hypothetical protein BC629DRAFT_254024 [Irpex lacteus]|nr:hypothetical protein BC629DRAFT_254024 [Irpex lacteus]
MSEHLHRCGACLEYTATRRCTGCQKVWYCSKDCQTAIWHRHIFECKPRRPINTADHLALAVYDDLLPTDQETLKDWGIDKAGLYSPRGPSMIFGLYVGLIKYCDVKPQQLHKWRLQGRLIPEIKAIYEAIPTHARGGYYAWFLEHQSILEDPEMSNNDTGTMAEGMQRRAWVALGNSPNASATTIRTFINNLPLERQICFKVYAVLLSSSHPGPDIAYYLWFGFCICPSLYEEMQLGRAYMALIDTCTFDEFCEAYSSGTLFRLFQKKNIPMNGIRCDLLADVLGGGPTIWKSVWDLKQFVAADGQGTLALSSTVDYGFSNCANSEKPGKPLFNLYKTFFEMRHADPLKLHAACVEGRLFKFFTEDISIKLPGSRKLFKRLLKNPYPLPESTEQSHDVSISL